MQIVKRLPLHQQAYELLKSKILSGELSEGERVNEIKLSQELGISRSPVREAIRMLEQDGLIISLNAGHIVNPLDEKTLNDVYECRIGLESYAARLATQHFTRKDYDILVASVERCKNTDPHINPQILIDLNTYYHDHIVSLTNNSYIISQVGRIRNIVILSRIKELTHYNRDLTYAYADHLAIAESMLLGDADMVETLMRRHLSNNRQSLMA